MAKILMITLIIIIAFSTLMMLFVRSGDAMANKYPDSGFAKWFRKHIVDQDPWDY